MLVIKKRFIQPMTYLYIGIGVAVFIATIGTLVVLRPALKTDRSVVINTSQRDEKPDKATTTEANSKGESSESESSTGTSSEAPQQSRPLTQPSAQIGVSKAQAQQQAAPTATAPSIISPAPIDIPSVGIQQPTEPTTGSDEPVDTSQQPSLIDNVLGGVTDLVQVVL